MLYLRATPERLSFVIGPLSVAVCLLPDVVFFAFFASLREILRAKTQRTQRNHDLTTSPSAGPMTRDKGLMTKSGGGTRTHSVRITGAVLGLSSGAGISIPVRNRTPSSTFEASRASVTLRGRK